MRKLVVLPSASADLENIFRYISHQTGNRATGSNFILKIKAKIDHLAESSFQLGRLRPELKPDLRSTALKNYVIFFRYVDDTLEIVNILEGHRDITAFYEED